MKVVVFTGPTLSADEASQHLEATYRPPVSQGDVYRACYDEPLIIGIIDGYFETVPAVWHKEILWAMTRGIHVFGSASMGALRAAELHSFGMEGVGAIFEAFRDGELEDDDEVAVRHGAAESGYRAISDSMVDIRATLQSACSAGVISESTATGLIDIAKSHYYADRAYPLILGAGADAGMQAGELEHLASWLQAGRVGQKRQDALAMLEAIRVRLESGITCKRVDYEVEPSKYWNRARRAADGEPERCFDLRATIARVLG